MVTKISHFQNHENGYKLYEINQVVLVIMQIIFSHKGQQLTPKNIKIRNMHSIILFHQFFLMMQNKE